MKSRTFIATGTAAQKLMQSPAVTHAVDRVQPKRACKTVKGAYRRLVRHVQAPEFRTEVARRTDGLFMPVVFLKPDQSWAALYFAQNGIVVLDA